MAVSKIHKISSWTLLILVVCSLIVLGLFFFGGKVDPHAAVVEPTYTGALLYWCYILLGLAICALLVFGLIGFIGEFRTNPKGAVTTLVVLALFAVLLIVTYFVGSGDPIVLGSGEVYNNPSTLKITDMFLYSIYTLIVLAICGVIWGAVKSALKK